MLWNKQYWTYLGDRQIPFKVGAFCLHTFTPVTLPLLEAPLIFVLGISKSYCIALNLILSTFSSPLPSKVFLIQGNRKKLHGVMSGKYRGWCMCGMWCLAKNCCTFWAKHASAVLWWMCHTQDCNFLGHIWQTASYSCGLLLLLTLQSLVDLSLFQNCPPLFSILRLMSPIPYIHVL